MSKWQVCPIYTVIGIGEVLWDLLPEGKQPGGAPANFVLYCGQLGADSYLVSTVGGDELGGEIKGVLAELGVKPDFLTTSRHYATGAAVVAVDQDRNPHYRIQENVAWDHIPWSPRLEELAKEADAIYFGSLAQRSPVTRETIHRILDCAGPGCLRVYDVNLRRPYPDSALLYDSLQKANVVKINTDELDCLGHLLGLTGDTPHRLAEIIRKFDLSCLALTRGGQGSVLATPHEIVDCRGLKIRVQDTVGAGDAFTAAMVMGLLRKWPFREINAAAERIATYVCSQVGAMVRLSPDLVGTYQPRNIPVQEYRAGKRRVEKSFKL